jgi:hypothetical protein
VINAQTIKNRRERFRRVEFVRQIVNPWGITMWHYEDRLFQYAIGENRQGCEVKFDEPCTRTGRLSIEIAEKTRAANHEWIASGIMRRDNSWLYIQGNYAITFIFAKNWLIRYYAEKIGLSDIAEYNGTVRKFYLPVKAAMIMAPLVLDGQGKRIGNGG